MVNVNNHFSISSLESVRTQKQMTAAQKEGKGEGMSKEVKDEE